MMLLVGEVFGEFFVELSGVARDDSSLGLSKTIPNPSRTR
jgi:hypothetical protein